MEQMFVYRVLKLYIMRKGTKQSIS